MSQADKNDLGDSTAYHITVGAVPGLSPVRVTARIYYRVIQSMVGPPPGTGGAGGRGGTSLDAGPVGGSRDGGSGQAAQLARRCDRDG